MLVFGVTANICQGQAEPLSSRVVAAEVRGFVFYADGETPAAGVPVRVWDVESRTFIHEVTTDRNGFYQLPRLESGVYYLTFDWTRIELVVVDAATGLAQQPHDVIAVIPRGVAFISIPNLTALLTLSTVTAAAPLFDEIELEDVVSP